MNFPCYESGQKITAGTASGTTAIAGNSGRVMAAKDILIWNPGPNHVHVRTGDASVTADDSCAPMPAGALWAYGKGPSTHIATVAIGGAQNIVVIVAEGS